jgi:transcriptional antiterminator
MSNLGKPKPHTAKQIRERREKVLILMSKGMNQSDIARELHTTRRTVLRDVKELNQWTKRGLYDLAKQTLPTMYFNCVTGQNELAKECWKLYKNPNNDPSINNWHKIAALRLLIDINKSKFQMFQDGPAFMEIGHLQTELGKIKDTFVKDNNFKPFVKPSTYEESMRLRDLSVSGSRDSKDKDNDKDKDKELVNALGIRYKIEKFDDNDDDSSQSQEIEKEEEEEDSELDKEDHE